MQSLATRCRAVVLSSIAALIVIVVAWQCASGLSTAAVARSALFSLPLLLPLHGLWRGHRYTYRWATLCVLPYFVVAVTEAFANPAARAWGIAMLGFALVWFFALIAFLRVTEVRG